MRSQDPRTVRTRIMRRLEQIERQNALFFTRPGCVPKWLDDIATKQKETLGKLRAAIEESTP